MKEIGQAAILVRGCLFSMEQVLLLSRLKEARLKEVLDAPAHVAYGEPVVHDV